MNNERGSMILEGGTQVIKCLGQMIKHAFVILLFVPLFLINAQRLDFNFFTVNDGLSDRQINELYLGEDGFLWVGTRDGLNRFDGYNFLPFGQGPFSDAGLSLGNIAKIGRDLEERIVIFYQDFNGYFDLFDPTSFALKKVSLNPATGVKGFPRALAIDALGRVFVVTVSKSETRLYEFTSAGFVSIATSSVSRERISPPANLLPLRNGQFLLFDGDQGLQLLSATGSLLDSIPLSQLDAAPLFDRGRFERLEFLEQGPNGLVYFSFYGHQGLYELDLEHQQRLSLAKGFPVDLYYQSVHNDQLGQLLFFASQQYERPDQPDYYFLLENNGAVSDYAELRNISSRIYSATAADFRKKVFLGLYDGLGILERRNQSLDTYLSVDQEEEFFQNLIRGITEDEDGNIYFSEQDGQLYRLDTKRGILDSIFLHQSAENGDLLAITNVNNLIYDPNGPYLWASGQAMGGRQIGLLYRYSLNDCSTKAFYYPEGTFSCLVQSDEGQLYLGSGRHTTNGQLLQFDQESELFFPVNQSNGEDIMQGAVPLCLVFDKEQKNLFIGTENKGLIRFDLEKNKAKRYAPRPWEDQAVVFNDYTIYDIELATEDDGLYLATRGGLHYFHPQTDEVVHYGRSDGLSSNIISAIVADTAGGYWISTYNGLNYFHPNHQPTFRNYSRADGLSNNEFNRLSAHRSSDGRFFFGGVNGLSTFRPQELAIISPAPKVLISRLVLYGPKERTISEGLNQHTTIEVSEDEKGIAVHFALPAAVSGPRHKFRVKLAGLSKEWVELGDEHIVRYNNLRAGSYTLYVQATDANGQYDQQFTTLDFKVRQYFYEQTWFLIAIGLVLVGFVIGFLQNRSRERLRNEKLRTQLSSDIHDEVSGLLAGITMQTELLQSYTEDDHLRTRLKGVGEAGRKAMSKMSDVIWSIDSRRDTTGDLLQRMQEHADEVLLPLDIKYTFRADGLNVKDRKLAGNKRQDIYFIYKEIINNIARHSNASRVNVYLGQQSQEFEMIIRDNGEATNGFDARRSAKTGQGLANLRMRASRLGADLTVDKEGDNSVRLRMRRL